MDTKELIVFLCITLPIIPIIFAIKDNNSKRFLIFFIIGLTICLVSSQINTILVNVFNMDILNYSVTISPINEEILKAIPLIYFAITFAKKEDQIVPLAYAIGIGFAIFESIVIFCNDMDNLTASWAIIRGIGASLMHSVCSATIAMGISYVLHNKKTAVGFIGLFSIAILYHATFNAFIQSQYSVIALIMPLLLFIPINIIEYRKRKYSKMEENDNIII